MLLGDIPPLLKDIVRGAVVGQPDIVLVEGSAGRRVPPRSADLVIVALPSSEEVGECTRLLRADPSLKVLAIGIEDGHGSLHELLPRRLSLGELSPEGLVQAIRRSCGPERVQ